jgi:hypothetical protein
MRRCLLALAPLLGLALLLGVALVRPGAAADARALEVGPGRPFATPGAAAQVAERGDRVLIAPGRYRDCATWRAPDLSIEAAGGEVVILGPVCGDKALFVVAAPRITITGLTFRGARAGPGNGAGIRAEGGDLTIRNSRFEDNQNGILSAAHMPQARLVIEDSVFVGNGARLGDCAHGLYAGQLGLVSIRRTRFEATRACHHVKSRASRTELIDCVIHDAPPGRASYLVDLPDGGDLLLQNCDLRKGPHSGNRRAAVVIGAEGARLPTASLQILGNRFENLQPHRTIFVRNLSGTPALLIGNALSGPVRPLQGPGSVR